MHRIFVLKLFRNICLPTWKWIQHNDSANTMYIKMKYILIIRRQHFENSRAHNKEKRLVEFDSCKIWTRTTEENNA